MLENYLYFGSLNLSTRDEYIVNPKNIIFENFIPLEVGILEATNDAKTFPREGMTELEKNKLIVCEEGYGKNSLVNCYHTA